MPTALQRVLADDSASLRVRLAACLVLLFAQPVSRIVRITTDDVVHDGLHVALRLDDPPIPVPEPVANLLLDYLQALPASTPAIYQNSPWLFPGRASQPMNPGTLRDALRRLGVPVEKGRTSALRVQCEPARMDDEHWRTWTRLFLTLLAADLPDQLAWLGERRLETETAVGDVEFTCRIAEGLTERGAFEPAKLRDLQAIGRRVGEIDAGSHTVQWAEALATDPAWDDVRTLARRFLVTLLGDWRQPLPRPVGPHAGDR